MPDSLTIFAASKLVYIDAVLAVIAVLYLLARRPADLWVRWAVAIVITAVVSGVLALIASHVISDPRPFTTDHVKPLISHSADNGFPSDHALLAAVIVAALLLIDPLWAIPFVILGVLVDWARVGAGIHHVQDVLGSSVIVAIGLLVALAIAPRIVGRVPAPWTERLGTFSRS